MVHNISNQNGRALEYKILEYLQSNLSSFSVELTKRAISDQDRDKVNFDNLLAGLKDSYTKCAIIVHDWLLEKLDNTDIVVDRIPDADAKLGDVTDIRIQHGSHILNLSIKHNHTALKHQRPPTTAERCGYDKGSHQDMAFRKEYDEVLESFLHMARKLTPNAQNFRDIVAIESNFINDNLYASVCELVTRTINDLCVDKRNVIMLFEFLVGSINFYKIVDREDKVIILDFMSFDNPTSVEATVRNKSYVDLKFSNGWLISMRIHTAASALGKSLKFDTQPSDISTIPETIIPKV